MNDEEIRALQAELEAQKVGAVAPMTQPKKGFVKRVSEFAHRLNQ